MRSPTIKRKSLTITFDSDEEMNRIKALMLSMDISFKVNEKYDIDDGSYQFPDQNNDSG